MLSCKSFFGVLSCIAVFSCGLCAQTGQLSKVFPISPPEQQGVSSVTLDSMMQFIVGTQQNLHHLTIIKNKHTILDADIYPYSSRYLHDVASVTKSITALLIGIAIDKGFIKNEDQPVLRFFPEMANTDSSLALLTIRHLVTMTSGFSCSSSDGEKALSDMRHSDDWTKFIFSLPIVAKPGTTFSYCSCNFYLLAEIIYRTTHLTPHAFAKKYLFEPLQFERSAWLANERNINHGWGDLFLYPADMAKIGQLILNKGQWNEAQIVSAKWIEKCLLTVNSLEGGKGYAYGWWTNDKGGFYEAAGRGRQTISVIPSMDMVVVMLGGEFDAGKIGSYVFKSVQSATSLPESAVSFAALSRSERMAATEPRGDGKVMISDSLLRALHGRKIIFEKNILEIDSMQFRFHSRYEGRVSFYKHADVESYPFMISTQRYKTSIDPTSQLPVALQAECKGSDEFVLHYNQLCRINNFYFEFTLKHHSIQTVVEETTNPLKLELSTFLK